MFSVTEIVPMSYGGGQCQQVLTPPPNQNPPMEYYLYRNQIVQPVDQISNHCSTDHAAWVGSFILYDFCLSYNLLSREHNCTKG